MQLKTMFFSTTRDRRGPPPHGAPGEVLAWPSRLDLIRGPTHDHHHRLHNVLGSYIVKCSQSKHDFCNFVRILMDSSLASFPPWVVMGLVSLTSSLSWPSSPPACSGTVPARRAGRRWRPLAHDTFMIFESFNNNFIDIEIIEPEKYPNLINKFIYISIFIIVYRKWSKLISKLT